MRQLIVTLATTEIALPTCASVSTKALEMALIRLAPSAFHW